MEADLLGKDVGKLQLPDPGRVDDPKPVSRRQEGGEVGRVVPPVVLLRQVPHAQVEPGRRGRSGSRICRPRIARRTPPSCPQQDRDELGHALPRARGAGHGPGSPCARSARAVLDLSAGQARSHLFMSTTGVSPPASAATMSRSMNRGRNGGDDGLVTQTARSAFAASTCGALPFLFHRTSRVLRRLDLADHSLLGLSGVRGHLDEVPRGDRVVASLRLPAAACP